MDFTMKRESVRMKARLVIVEPARDRSGWPIVIVQADPGDPNATTEDLKVRLIGDDWALPLPHQAIEDVTEDEVRNAMKLSPTLSLRLTSVRYPPQDQPWISTQMLEWMDAWRCAAIAEWKSLPIAMAS
jgi:hypothetical protein